MILSAKIRTKFDFSKYLAVISVSLRTLPLPSGFCLYSAGGGAHRVNVVVESLPNAVRSPSRRTASPSWTD